MGAFSLFYNYPKVEGLANKAGLLSAGSDRQVWLRIISPRLSLSMGLSLIVVIPQAADPAQDAFLGILDIFGFEFVEKVNRLGSGRELGLGSG